MGYIYLGEIISLKKNLDEIINSGLKNLSNISLNN
jgi:hypothetical protein